MTNELKSLRKLGFDLVAFYKSDRSITFTLQNDDVEEEIEVIVYKDGDDIDFIFDKRMYIRLEVMEALVDIDWRGIESGKVCIDL